MAKEKANPIAMAQTFVMKPPAPPRQTLYSKIKQLNAEWETIRHRRAEFSAENADDAECVENVNKYYRAKEQIVLQELRNSITKILNEPRKTPLPEPGDADYIDLHQLSEDVFQRLCNPTNGIYEQNMRDFKERVRQLSGRGGK